MTDVTKIARGLTTPCLSPGTEQIQQMETIGASRIHGVGCH